MGRRTPGQALIIVMLTLSVLVLATSLAIDGARLHLESIRVQNAADQAALAGAIAASQNGESAITPTVNTLVARNLPVNPGITVSDTIELIPGGQTHVHVTVTETGFPLFLSHGLNIAITRDASGTYASPGQLGNPSNVLGDPNASISTYAPTGTVSMTQATVAALPQNLSLAINGPDQLLESGDPYSPIYVNSSSPVANVTTPMTNPYRTMPDGTQFGGYNYRITVPANPAGGATYVQVFDAETCASADGHPENAVFGDSLTARGYGIPYSAAATRYPVAHYGPYPTYYRLYWLDPTTGNAQSVPTGNILSGVNPSTIARQQGVPADTIIAPTEGISGTFAVTPTLPVPSCTSGALANYTGKWFTLAKIDASIGGSYKLNVTTCLDAQNRTANSSPDGTANLPSCEGSQINNYSLRAITVGNGPAAQVDCNGNSITPGNTDPLDCQSPNANSSAQPVISGLGNISVMVRATGQALLYLTRIGPQYAGATIGLKFFDPGDVAGGASMQIVRPDGSYAPLQWTTQGLTGNGTPYTTTINNTGSTSLIVAYPASGLGPNTATPGPTLVPTSSPTTGPTFTATDTPTSTPTPTVTDTPTNTGTPTDTATNTPTVTGTPPTNTPTGTATDTPTITPTPTNTSTAVPTATPTSTPVNTTTPTPMPSPTPTDYAPVGIILPAPVILLSRTG